MFSLVTPFSFRRAPLLAVSCMLALDSVHYYYGHTPAPASVDINAVLRAMAVSCRQLRKVLCRAHYMTDSFASALAAVLTSNVRLERLDLCRNGSATAPMPKALADAFVLCRSLQCLVVDCSRIDDSQMLPIVASVRWVKFCPVSGATGLTDAFFTALSEHCRDLAWLHVNNSALLTASGLRKLIKRCPRLYYLEVHPDSMSPVTAVELSTEKRLYKIDVRVWA
jgi:hypothetical protein